MNDVTLRYTMASSYFKNVEKKMINRLIFYLNKGKKK